MRCKICSNQVARRFAQQFATSTGTAHGLMTCFTVLEHLVKPIDEMLQFSANTPVTALPHTQPARRFETWWDLAPARSRDISLCAIGSHQSMARMVHLHLGRDGVGPHLLSGKRLRECIFKLISGHGLTAALPRRVRRRWFRTDSLLMCDGRDVTGWSV